MVGSTPNKFDTAQYVPSHSLLPALLDPHEQSGSIRLAHRGRLLSILLPLPVGLRPLGVAGFDHLAVLPAHMPMAQVTRRVLRHLVLLCSPVSAALYLGEARRAPSFVPGAD